MVDNIETGVNDVEVAAPQTVEPENSEVVAEPAVESGAADQTTVPDGNKPNAAWADMRKKAKEADELKTKLDKLSKALPDGYGSIDEFLEALDSPQNYTPAVEKDTVDETKVSEIVKKIIDNAPEIKSFKEEHRNRFLVDSFNAAQKAFSDIKKAEDIPLEVWEAWDEGKSGRTLVSHLKEYRYDGDIQKARQQGASQATAQVMSKDHLNQVQGTQSKTEYDDIVVPDETRKMLERVGIKDPQKQKEAYKKYHRPI